MELQRARGMRDFLPEEKILRDQVVKTLREVFERYGFNPLETPVVERYDMLASKYAGGAEILKETFRLKDQGGRELALRYDLTVPFARVVGMNPGVKMPFKRYQMGEIFRDGPLRLGRYRSFVQCDVDVVGVSSVRADAELLLLAQDVFRALGLDVVIRVNSRKVLDALLVYAKIPVELQEAALLSLDKVEKFGRAVVEDELRQKGVSDVSVARLFEVLEVCADAGTALARLKTLLVESEGVKELEEIFSLVSGLVFDVSLARGLSYYTGPVFEVFLGRSLQEQLQIRSSMAAGGRYDRMIGGFLGRGEFPATGISFGLDVVCEALKALRLGGQRRSVVQVCVIPIGTFQASLNIAQQLRSSGVNTFLDVNERGISRNLDFADKQGVPFVVFVGGDELARGKVKVRDMRSGVEELVTVQEVVRKVKGS